MLFDAAIMTTPIDMLWEWGQDDGDALALMMMALATVLVEVPLFYLCGYRSRRELTCFAGVNLLSNVLLNEFLGMVSCDEMLLPLLLGELTVIVLEFCLCCYFVNGSRKKLLATLVLTNAASFLAGWAFFVW